MASEATSDQVPIPNPGGTGRTGPDDGSVAALTALRELPGEVRLRAVAYGAVAAVVIGVPADLIDTPLFGRPVPVRPVDHVIWAITSLLIGLVFAIRADRDGAAGTGAGPTSGEAEQTRALWGGFASFLSVGCPVCNQAVVALVGTSGALSWWAPVQPVIGAAAIALLVVAVRRRLLTYRLDACPLPA